jgi:hypothetical protein
MSILKQTVYIQALNGSLEFLEADFLAESRKIEYMRERLDISLRYKADILAQIDKAKDEIESIKKGFHESKSNPTKTKEAKD